MAAWTLDAALHDPEVLIARATAFAREVVAPQVSRLERERRIGREAIREAARLGLCAIEAR